MYSICPVLLLNKLAGLDDISHTYLVTYTAPRLSVFLNISSFIINGGSAWSLKNPGKCNELKEPHPSNIEIYESVWSVAKLLRLTESRELQFLNIRVISLTQDVLKLDKSNDNSDEQPSNIPNIP